ncbi:beta-1,3-galactosyltransferase 5-like isoform X2 [Eriocheir sinensis]|uniref:beta-1,3-galactosyltransferase 5-like isoform X2 n=1 Tax=Eriocheir sinensis TaxID=95602 RepID=UPI0021C8392C|nr:beta-1,3-galactosyltransferase 5-like isoform X2 [Eriocheir sinensis]
MWRFRVFSPSWFCVTASAFLLTYLLLPLPTPVIQVKWPPPNGSNEVEVDEGGGGGEGGGEGGGGGGGFLDSGLLRLKKNWTDSSNPSRFKFIYSRKKLILAGRPKVNHVTEEVRFRHDPDHVCVLADPPTLTVALVLSAVGHEHRRAFIRDSWARPAWYPHSRLKTVFVLGATSDPSLQEAVDREAKTHRDIVQYNFIDSYANLTYKTLSLLSWGVTRCPNALFLVKVDDDVLLNPFHLHTYLQQALEQTPTPSGVYPGDELFQGGPDDHPATTHIYGRFDPQPYPLRTTKWALTMEEYPEKVFPPFVHGPAYILGRAAARELLRYAPYIPLIKLEDVYTTGLVARAAGLRHVQIFGSVSTFKAGPGLYNGTQAILEETGDKGRAAAWEEILKYAPSVEF